MHVKFSILFLVIHMQLEESIVYCAFQIIVTKSIMIRFSAYAYCRVALPVSARLMVRTIIIAGQNTIQYVGYINLVECSRSP